jgi:hypothetical protein
MKYVCKNCGSNAHCILEVQMDEGEGINKVFTCKYDAMFRAAEELSNNSQNIKIDEIAKIIRSVRAEYADASELKINHMIASAVYSAIQKMRVFAEPLPESKP